MVDMKQIVIVKVPPNNLPPAKSREYMKGIAKLMRETIDKAQNSDQTPVLVCEAGTMIESLWVEEGSQDVCGDPAGISDDQICIKVA